VPKKKYVTRYGRSRWTHDRGQDNGWTPAEIKALVGSLRWEKDGWVLRGQKAAAKQLGIHYVNLNRHLRGWARMDGELVMRLWRMIVQQNPQYWRRGPKKGVALVKPFDFIDLLHCTQGLYRTRRERPKLLTGRRVEMMRKKSLTAANGGGTLPSDTLR